MDIEPVSLSHFVQTSDERMVEVPDDVTNVARDLRALDPTLRLRYSEAGGYFVVYQRIDEGGGRTTDHLVTTAQECDQRIVRKVEQIMHPSYDLVGELQRGAAERRKRKRDRFREEMGVHGERLAHALRRDLGAKHRIFVP